MYLTSVGTFTLQAGDIDIQHVDEYLFIGLVAQLKLLMKKVARYYILTRTRTQNHASSSLRLF